jgi:hypothetical protein
MKCFLRDIGLEPAAAHPRNWQTKPGSSLTQRRLSRVRCDFSGGKHARERADENKIDACQWHSHSREVVQGKDIEMTNENVSGLWHFATPRAEIRRTQRLEAAFQD